MFSYNVYEAWVNDCNGVKGKCLFFKTLDRKGRGINEYLSVMQPYLPFVNKFP